MRHRSAQEEASSFARQATRGDITANFSGNLNARLDGRADLYLAIPSYTFSTPASGAQAMIAMAIPYGSSFAGVNATLNGVVGPREFTVSGGTSDNVLGFGDLLPMFSLRWNAGVNNHMACVTTNTPTGVYNPDNLVNLGIGHAATDAGGAYSYFNPQTGNELSGTLGFTYNYENRQTQYQNGVDMHFDWGASHFLTKQWQIGAVGYAYHELSCDSGAGDHVGCFRVARLRRWRPSRLHHPDGETARLSECESLQRICRGKSRLWLECLANVCCLASGTGAASRAAMKDHARLREANKVPALPGWTQRRCCEEKSCSRTLLKQSPPQKPRA